MGHMTLVTLFSKKLKGQLMSGLSMGTCL